MPTKHGNKVKVQTLISPDVYERFAAQAKADNRSVSSLIAILVEVYVYEKQRGTK